MAFYYRLIQLIKRNLNLFREAGILLCSFGLIGILLASPPRANITSQYYEMGFEKIIFLLCIFTLLMHLRGWWGYVINLTAILSLFLLALIYKWQTADNFLLLGGFFPQRDGLDYYTDAQRLLHGFYMTGSGTYRPIYSSFLAVLMKATSSNLQLMLIILTICNALVVYLAAKEIHNILKNNFASAVYIIISYMFFRRFSGTLLTENLGLCLGNLALIFLIRGSFLNKPNQILYGIFLLTIALNARAGAFLVLPILAIWLGISYQKEHGFWRSFLISCLAVLLGMAANFVVARITTSPEAKTFSNYSYTLYGLASGNKGWEQAIQDYPNADTNQIYSLAMQKILNDPALFFNGIRGAYHDYFISSTGAFSFLVLKHDRGDIANQVLWLLTFIGLIAAFINRKEKIFSISLAFFLGIFISVSLVPPADSHRMRVYAATIPLTGYIIASGIVFIRNLFKQNNESNSTLNQDKTYLPVVLSVLFLTTCLVLPIFVKWVGKPVTPDKSIVCLENEKPFTFSVAKGSSIRLITAVNKSYVPNLDISQFSKKIIRPEQQISEENRIFFLGLAHGTILTLVSGNEKPFAQPEAISLITTDLPGKGIYTVCLTPTPVDGYYYANLSENQKTVFPISLEERYKLVDIFHMVKISILVIVILIILIDFYDISNLSREKWLLGLANTAMLSASILFIMHHFGILPLAFEEKLLDVSQARHQGDKNLYSINIGTDKISDTDFREFPVNLYEDGILLAPPHESQSLIDIYGGGSYILKGNFLFFSTSDNSDPRTNGREYLLTWPTQLRLRYQIIAYTVLLLSLVIHYLFIRDDQTKYNHKVGI